MDLRSTKKGLIGVRRFCEPRSLSTASSFRGAIESGFTEWIRNHWRFSQPGRRQPASTDFFKRKNPFALLRWPRARRVGVVNYTFSPTLTLSCSFDKISNAIFESDGNRIFQSVTLQMNTQNAAGERSLGPSFGRGPGERSRVRTINREPRRDGTLLLLNLNRLNSSEINHLSSSEMNRLSSSEMVRNIWSWRAFSDSLPHMLSSAVVTILRSAEGRTIFLNRKASGRHSELAQLPGIRYEREGSATFTLGSILAGPLSVFASASAPRTTLSLSLLEKTRMAHDFKHSFSMGLQQIRHGLSSAARSFTSLSLNFAAPGSADAEVLNKQIAHFVSSPALTYAKRESMLSESVVKALREFQTVQNERSVVATPQLPSIENLTRQVREQLERDLRIEKERRGL